MRLRRRDRETLPNKEYNKSTGTKIADAFQVPPSALLNLFNIELSGNSEAVVEGCKGVLEYDESIVRLNMGKMVVRFCGRNLQLKCMENESLIIAGFIISMDFSS